MSRRFRWFYLLFFVSGFPALIYQIVWQRALFAIFGVNIESVTIVVTAFMLGLGLGSLAGGKLSESFPAPLALFGVMELGIAAYGIVSLPLFHAVARMSAAAPPLQTGLLSFALVVLPTMFMGATLPLLVAQLVRLSGNVGRSVGILYFVNTLGSAVACFIAAWFTMPQLGMFGSVLSAAALNILVGASVLALYLRSRLPATAPAPPPEPAAPLVAGLPFPFAILLAALSGFISLCYEIVWYRLYSFASGGPAQCFAYVLGAFLLGVALGSLLSRSLCRTAFTGVQAFARSAAGLILFASLIGFSMVPLVAFWVRFADFLWTLPLVTLVAALLGAVFPLICHISVRPDSSAGAGLGYLYLSNIVGSAAGAWILGFVLLDLWSLRAASVFLAVAGVLGALVLVVASAPDNRRRLAAGALAAAAIGFVLLTARPLFASVYGEMQSQADWGKPGTWLANVVETRSGVVTVDGDDAIFGGGVFDGWVITDIHRTDFVIEPLTLSLFHPDPKQVLVVGMSGGAWSQIIDNHPRVEKQVIVEINPGYVQIARRYPAVAPFLDSPKTAITIDDGRRWMLRHRERRFDVIVMDTIYHWRAHATNLLSREFLEMARTMLNPGGIMYVNVTYSPEAERTAASVFPYAYRFGIFMIVGDSPIPVDRERWRATLLGYALNGKPVFNPASPKDQALLARILKMGDPLPPGVYEDDGLETRENILLRTKGKRIVTDDNMATEWGDYDWRH
jgi:predicted membrane-bound spermidine synthase